jgi:nucleoside-diphosphate-sugar epimerase
MQLKVLVTGAKGFVGRHVVEYLTKHGYETIETDVVGNANAGSVTERTFVKEKLGRLDFDAVVHLAGIADLKKTIDDPYLCYEVNCLGTMNMLELALKKNVKRFIFPSSANVYGAPRKNPVTEEARFEPRVPYDYSKVAGESLCMGYYRAKSLPVAITRSWLLFGEYDQPTRAVPRFIGAALRNEPIKLFNSGRDTTAPVHATNYGKLVATILEKDSSIGEAFNFGGEKALSIRELAELIKMLTGSRSELQLLPPRSEAEAEPQISYPSNEKLRRVLGYEPEVTLEAGLRRTAEWVRAFS